MARVRFSDSIEWSKWFSFFYEAQNSGSDEKRHWISSKASQNVWNNFNSCSSCTYNHNIHYQLNSLNFQMTAKNLNVIYRFILKEIQCLNGDRNKMKGKERKQFGQFRNTLPTYTVTMWNELCNNLKWLILSSLLLLLLLFYC